MRRRGSSGAGSMCPTRATLHVPCGHHAPCHHSCYSCTSCALPQGCFHPRHATSVCQGNWFSVGIGPVSKATE